MLSERQLTNQCFFESVTVDIVVFAKKKKKQVTWWFFETLA
jgi:hypothetical protein